ncbi:MAG: hypothetical protein GF419_11690 [Ignavibacteriales bacterium]|nr:hypothetical protein [Ignavibacteriales bacterium]
MKRRKIRVESIAGLVLAVTTLVFSCVFSQTDFYRARFADHLPSSSPTRVETVRVSQPTNEEFAKALFTDFVGKNDRRLRGFFLVSNRLAP